MPQTQTQTPIASLPTALSTHAATGATLLAATLACWLVLIPIRAHVMGYGWYFLSSPLDHGLSVVAGAYLDLVYLLLLAAGFAAILRFVRRRRLRIAVLALFVLTLIASAVYAIINIQIVQIIGQPLNYPWLYNSGFLRGLSEPSELASSLSPERLLTFAAVIAALLVLILPLRHLLLHLRRRFHATGIVLLVAALIYLPSAAWYHAGFYRPMLQNPVVAFASSLFEPQSMLFTLETSITDDDYRFAADRPVVAAALPSTAPTDPAVRNVLVIVLESVAAQYLSHYGGAHAVTPELERYRDITRIYDAVYTHAPNTNKSLVSLLCSTYPAPDFRLETIEHAGAPFSSLSSILKRSGYRTGLFYGADLRFGDSDRFLKSRDFDHLADFRTIGDGRPTCISRSGMPFLDSTDDAALVQHVIPFLREDPDTPFFALLWTAQTHYPYFVMGPSVDYLDAGGMQNRYLNALRETDAAIGQLLRSLEASGQLDSTLIVILGDHGEAFGQHNQYGHGSRIYQENIHIPFLLINPRLFSSHRDATVGGIVDVAPTILDLLRLPAPSNWQGRSLFDPARPARTWFMASWSSALFGYRDSSRKYIVDGHTGACEVYDLATDPAEAHNLAHTLTPEHLTHIQQRLAAFVQYQHKALQSLPADSKLAAQ